MLTPHSTWRIYNIFLQVAHFLVLRLLQLSGLLKLPFLFINEGSQHMTLTRSEVQLRQMCVGVLEPLVDEVEDQL